MKSLLLSGLLLLIGLVSAAEREIPVRTTLVKSAPLQQELPLTGIITAQRVSNLSSKVDALVTRVRVEAGQFVNQGDTLIELDNEMAEFAVKRAEAALAEATARLQESIRLRDELGKLIKNQYLAKSSYEASVAEVHINSSVVKRLEVEFKRDLEQVNRHYIKAPFSGVISKKMVEAGQWLKVGNAVLELVDIENLRAEVAVPQRYFSKLQQKTPTTLYLDALSGQRIDAEISYIIPVASNTAHTFPVHIEIDNHQHRYTPGMTLRVVFQLTSAVNGQETLQVPRDAVIKQNNREDTVWIVKQENNRNRVYPIQIKTGRIQHNNVEIISGDLKTAQQIVIRGNEILKPGQAVKILP